MDHHIPTAPPRCAERPSDLIDRLGGRAEDAQLRAARDTGVADVRGRKSERECEMDRQCNEKT